MNTCCAVIILGHGTRRQEASQCFFDLVARIGRRLAPVRVVPACFSCGSPTLNERVTELAGENITRIIIFPYFLLSGRHIADELPEVVQKLGDAFPQIRFDLLESMKDEPLLEAAMVSRLESYVQENEGTDRSMTDDEEIMNWHFATTDQPAGHFPLFRALALATGDLALAADIHRYGPVERAFAQGIAAGKPLLCDTCELAAGLTALGFKAVCIPSSCQAQDFLTEHMAGSVIVIGSQATLINTVVDTAGEPALVIGLAPGFTLARAAKTYLAQSDLTSIVNGGTCGGISCALAIVRALVAMTQGQETDFVPGPHLSGS